MSELKCEQCQCPMSKGEAEFIDEDNFKFLPAMPAGLKPGGYCAQCFDSFVRGPLNDYNELVDKAGKVNVFYLTQSKESRFVRRIEKPVQTKDCDDRDEVVMRLAFQAVQIGKNSLVDVDFKSEKVRMGGYQTSLWSGRGVPAQIDEAHLARRFRGVPN